MCFRFGLQSEICDLKSEMFHVVLIEPEIPPNTGNIGRLCLATGAHLHLVKPLGFSLDDRQLRRAGLDYWHEVRVSLWDSLADLRAAQLAVTRYFFLTTKSQRAYWSAEFRDGDFLVFGRETKGLPEWLLAENAERTLTIPMRDATRSLNLATAVGIVLYEAVRQTRVCGTGL
jgi:tRNA (cytidine/uridine-2'-O-)-methyltransferase